MTALEARTLAYKMRFMNSSRQYQEIKGIIEIKAKQEQFSTNYYGDLSDEVQTILESEGYKIQKTLDGRNGYDITISW